MNTIAPHILVVDDSPSVQQLLATLLEKKGYRVSCFTSGEEALKQFHAVDYDLVLTDINLPGMSGLNLLKLIRQAKPEIEVIVITSNASSYTAIQALRFGAYDYIVKPIDDHELLYNVVGRTLEKHQLSIHNRILIQDLSEKNSALQEALNMMQTVNKVCGAIASTLDVSEILRMLVESAVEQLGAKKGYLLLLDKNGTNFSMKVSVGIDQAISNSFTMGRDNGISGMVVAKNNLVRIGETFPKQVALRIFDEDPTGSLFATPGILSAPLNLKDKVVGVVTISGRKNGKPFSDAEADFITTLATHAAIALVNAGNFYRLKKNG